jgi:hypothetical protein
LPTVVVPPPETKVEQARSAARRTAEELAEDGGAQDVSAYGSPAHAAGQAGKQRAASEASRSPAPAEREEAEFETPEEAPATGDLPADVLVAEATVVVDDLTDVDGIPSRNGEDSEQPKKRWRLFRKGGDA